MTTYGKRFLAGQERCPHGRYWIHPRRA